MFANQAIKSEIISQLEFFSNRRSCVWVLTDIFVSSFSRFHRYISKSPLFIGKNKTEITLSRKEFEAERIECHQQDVAVLRFEISVMKMRDLLTHRQICASDIRCLDANSRQCLKKLCLKSCLYSASFTPDSSNAESFDMTD